MRKLKDQNSICNTYTYKGLESKLQFNKIKTTKLKMSKILKDPLQKNKFKWLKSTQ